MTNARNLANLLGGSTTISIESLGDDIPVTEKFTQASELPAGANIGEQAFVEETNRLYIWNGSGWYNIALINTTPTWDSNGQPNASYILDADSPQTATTIILAASDPEGTPVSYNYVTGGSMDSIATISQDSSVFTITPKTSVQAPGGGTGSITFRATDGINILPQVSSFTLNFVSVMDDSKYTTLLATGTNGTVGYYSLSGASYDSITLDTSSEGTGYQVFAFNNDGTKLFRIDSTIIYQYTLTTGFDLSTGSYDNISFTIPSNQGNAARAIQFNNDGTKMYVYTSSNTRISQYALTTGFDLGSASYDNKLYNGTTGNSGFTFNNDGTKLFKATASSKTIETHNLSSAFDISTASDASDSFSTASQTTGTAFQVQFNSDGTKMFVMDWVGGAGNNIYQYTLTQPYVVSSASYDNINYNYNNQESSPNDFKFSNDGSKMYIGGFATDRIHQYSTVSRDNNNITDTSSNNHSITVNGDAHTGTFSPYRSGGYSGLFDSTSVVQLSFAGSSDFEFGSANFTIEMWFKWNSSNKPDTTIFSNRISGSTFTTGSYFLKLMPGDITTGGIEFAFDCGPRYRLNCVDNLTADDAFFDEGWHHYAAVRNGTSFKLFVDGQEVDEITLPANETNFGNSSVNIGLGINNGVSSPSGPDGEYRDVRIVKGVAITPPSGGPTETLDAVSGTTFLLYNGEGYVKDKTSNHSPTYGSTAPTITATSPYDYNEYDAADHGGSVYFDGTGDTLEISQSTNVGAFGTNDFTVQLWYYTEANGNTDYLIDFRQYGANGDYLSIFKNGSNKIVVAEGGSDRITGTKDIGIGQWFFITVHRDNGSLKLFVNGAQDGSTYSDSTNYVAGGSGNFIIGKNNGSASYLMEGYLSDIKVTHGSALDGTTVPTAPLSSSGAELHIKGTDASIIDKSQGFNLNLVGDTTGSTTQTKFSNTKSMYFDGTGDYIPVITDFFYEKNTSNASTTKFTIETWVYHTARLTSSGYNHIFQTIVGLGNVGMSFGIGPSGNLKFYHQSGSTNVVSSTSTISLNTWTHIAVIVDGSQGSSGVTLKINGTTDGTGSWSGISTSQSDQSTPYSSPHFTIGRYPDAFASHQQFEGYLQDLRISNIARTITSAPTASLEG